MKTNRELPPLDPLQRYTLEEAWSYLRISRARLFEHIASQYISVIREGSRTFVPGSEIARLSAIPPPLAKPSVAQPARQ